MPTLTSKLALAERVSRISVSSTMKVAAEADRLRRAGVDVVDFSAGEPDHPTPANIKRAGIAAIENNFTKYTPAAGSAELRAAACERHKLNYGTSYVPAECVINVGGKHGLFGLTQVLLEPGDEVIIPVPYWVTYKDVVNYAGAQCVFVNTAEEQGFRLTAAMLEPYITPKTKMVIFNSPSNPSGAVTDPAEAEKILGLARQHDFWLLTDECYDRFLYEAEPYSMASFAGAKEHVVVTASLSKTYAMTGWRIGFTLTPAHVAGALNKLQSHSTSNPTSIAQKAAVEALSGPQESVGLMLAEYRKRREYVLGRLRGIPGVKAQTPLGAFYAYPNISCVFGKDGINSAMEFAEKLLAEAAVALVPGEAFGTQQHVRISYATSMHELERGLDRIEKFIQART